MVPEASPAVSPAGGADSVFEESKSPSDIDEAWRPRSVLQYLLNSSIGIWVVVEATIRNG